MYLVNRLKTEDKINKFATEDRRISLIYIIAYN